MTDQQQIDEILQRVAGDLSMIADRELKLQPAQVQRASARVAGQAGVQISFKLGFEQAGRVLHGALLVPLPDAQALAAYLMMLPEESVQSKRAQTTLDGVSKVVRTSDTEVYLLMASAQPTLQELENSLTK